jgi:hypothetical protein
MSDVHLMFQNFIDYSTCINPSHSGLRYKVMEMYEKCLALYDEYRDGREIYENVPRSFHLDGKTERFRRCGQCYHELCRREDAMRQRMLDQEEKDTIHELTERWIPSVSHTGKGENKEDILFRKEMEKRKRIYEGRVRVVLSRYEERSLQCTV